MRLSELLKTTDVSNFTDREIRGITCRADETQPDWAYVCRVGTRVDGHDFIPLALARGASVILTDRALDLPCAVRVRDTAAAWPTLCAAWFGHPTERLSVIGVTGTNGKTSTCHTAHAQLTACGVKAGLVGTVENRIGHLVAPADHTTPDAYDLQRLFALMVADGCTHAVMEVSSHALEQGRVAGVRFAAGVFTNLTEDHLDYHRTMDAYAAAKRRLFAQSRVAVLNADDPYADTMIDGFCGNVWRFGAAASADVTATRVTPCADGTRFTLHIGGFQQAVTLPLIGGFAVSNALASTAALAALGFAPSALATALTSVTPVRGRAETVGFFRGARIVIDYAHTPDGLLKIGQALRPYTGGNLKILFGCGGDRDRAKRPLMAKAAASVADELVVTDDNPRTEDPARIRDEIVAGLRETATPYTVIPDRRTAIEHLLNTAGQGDTLVLAGKGHETVQILNGRTVAFDERAIVQRIIESEDTRYGMETHHHGDCGVRRIFTGKSAR